MTVDCLVCGKPTSTTNLGMDACRACTVFYRRNRSVLDRLFCANGTNNCMDDKDNLFTCRKCRLTRFEEVIKAGSGEQKTTQKSTQKQTPVEFEKKVQGMIHQSSGKSIIEKIRDSHHKLMPEGNLYRYCCRALSAFRRTSEVNLRGLSIDPADASDDKYELVPSTYRLMNEGTKILIVGLFDFVSAIFPEFRALPKSDKWLLMRNYHRCFHLMDSTMRMRKRHKTDLAKIFASYTSYVCPETMHHFFSDCPDTTNVEAAVKTFLDSYAEVMPKLMLLILTFDPSDEEFLATMGLAFWSLENLEVSDKLLDLATRYRTEIVAEMTAHYRRTMGEERAATRMGLLLCMLQEGRRIELNLKTDYEVFRMLDVFDDNTLTYTLQPC